MKNKCPNCGYEYNENDAYCAMCGIKLQNKTVENDNFLKNELENSYNNTLENIKIFEQKKEDKINKQNFNFSFLYDNVLFNFTIMMILISLLLGITLFGVIDKQNNKKDYLQFENYIANPQTIPELKQPSNFRELKADLKSIENFLTLYLKYSTDTKEKKNKVFANYMMQMEKLPHITNENLIKDDLDSCSVIKSFNKAKKCAKKVSSDLKTVGILAYNSGYLIYLYPD